MLIFFLICIVNHTPVYPSSFQGLSFLSQLSIQPQQRSLHGYQQNAKQALMAPQTAIIQT